MTHSMNRALTTALRAVVLLCALTSAAPPALAARPLAPAAQLVPGPVVGAPRRASEADRPPLLDGAPRGGDDDERARDDDRELDDPTPLRLGIGGFAGAPTDSRIRVREHDLRGDRLRLSKDLGIDVVGELAVGFGWRIDPDDALVVSLSHVFLYGSARRSGTTEFNGAFVAPGRITTEPLYLVIGARYERALVHFGEGGRGVLALELGLRMDIVSWKYQGTIAFGSPGKEKGEGFDRQAMPIPMPGLSVRVPLTDDLDLVACGRGFRANHWSSGRQEGGTIYHSQTTVEAAACLEYHASPRVALFVGYRYLSVRIDQRSREDGNHLIVETHGGVFGATFSF